MKTSKKTDKEKYREIECHNCQSVWKIIGTSIILATLEECPLCFRK